MNKFYITTPIYYPSNNLHIGNAYTTIFCDAIARYKKLRGFDVLYLTGTDEHGQKIEQKAKEKGVSPKEFVDEIVKGIKELWSLLEINYDIYIRTTDEKHVETVQKIFKKLYDKGDIYKGEYEGLYCFHCESFFTEHQASDGNCPDCGRPVQKVKEEAYFFKLSNYQDKIIKLFEENPDFLIPSFRMQEMLNSFIKPGLEDLCVSRTSIKWGVPVSFDPKHVVYVWIDALPNYISALGYDSDDDSMYQKYWPADLHVMAKEIVRFHTIIWPAILMALDVPLPKQVYAHGFWLFDNDKMSKSKGNVVDPVILINRYGVDALRYFSLRDMGFGQDANFTNEAFCKRINSDLANDLGNLLSRTVGMIDKYFGGKLPAKQEPTPFDDEIIRLAKQTITKVEENMDTYHVSQALVDILAFVSRLNKYTDETEPWVLIKDEANKPKLANVLYNLVEGLRILSVILSPYMPNFPNEIKRQLNITDDSVLTWESTKKFGLLKKDVEIKKGEPVFPRLDIAKELKELQEISSAETKKSTVASTSNEENRGLISIDDFAKVNFKVGKVLECEKVKGSDKLLKSQIKIGDEVRQIVSGIALHYSPEEMVGKELIVVTNLAPIKLRGEISEGMILAASDDEGNLQVVTVDNYIKEGSVVR